MPESNGFILGFDPGGKGKFGWSICRVSNGQLQQPLETGLADDAWDALLKVKQELGRYSPSGNPPVLAAGIDAPMFWSKRGNRTVDDVLRDTLKDSLPKIRVLAVNSLWGAVLVQGMLVGKYLREEWRDLKITEAHPNALWYLLRHSEQSEVAEPLRPRMRSCSAIRYPRKLLDANPLSILTQSGQPAHCAPNHVASFDAALA